MTITQITANLNLLKSKYETAAPEERAAIEGKIQYLEQQLINQNKSK